MHLNTLFMHTLKILAFLFFISNINIANAALVTVNIEDSGVFNWDPIQKRAPGFGSSGPITLDWDPNNDFFTELLAYDRGYSGGAAAFCWYGENCALQLSVTTQSTSVQLKSFVLSYYGYGNNVQYSVIDLATQTSILEESPWVDGNIGSLITVNAISNKGFLILFGPDGFNGGINNITYSYQNQVPVQTPIPTAAFLFGIGLFGMIGFTRPAKLIDSGSDNLKESNMANLIH